MEELGERIGVTAPTISKIERGDPSVSLGAAFEAAALLGVPLFHADPARLAAERAGLAARSALLPRPSRRRATERSDDF